MPGIRRSRPIGIVIEGDEDEDKVRYCDECLKLHTLSRLKQRLYLDDKGKVLPPPPDAEDWLQCWICGLVVPYREVKNENQLSGVSGIEPIDNPFDFGKITVEPIKPEKRLLKMKRKKHPDKEVQKELANGATELISYVQD